MVIDLDDFGANHVISEQTQSHDCRDALDKLHFANLNLKVTLFTIPGEMTAELAEWCKANDSWVQLALHGFFHDSNYECSEMSYDDFDKMVNFFQPMLDNYFVKGFKAPGWQISSDIYRWLQDHGWWVSDQAYNNDRRPPELPAYVHDKDKFYVNGKEIESWHGHTWDCVGNGIYESFDLVEAKVKATDHFSFISEVINA